MTFNEWLQSLGIRIQESDGGTTYYYSPDGQRYTRSSPEYQQFYSAWRQQVAPWEQYGMSENDYNSMVSYAYGASGIPSGATEGGAELINIGGEQYYRVGPIGNQYLSDLGGHRDDKYGFVIPKDTWDTFQSQQTPGFWDGPGPFFLALGGLAAVAAPAMLAGTAATEGGLGGLATATSEFGGSLATGAFQPGTIANALVAGGTPFEVATSIAAAVEAGVPLADAMAQYGISPDSLPVELLSDAGQAATGGFEDVVQPDWFPNITDDISGNYGFLDTGSDPSEFLSGGYGGSTATLPGASSLGGGIMGPLQTAGSVAGGAGTLLGATGGGGSTPVGGVGDFYGSVDENAGIGTGNPSTVIPNIPGLPNIPGVNWSSLLPMLLGGAAGGLATPGDYTATTTQTTDVPERYRPYMDALINAAVPFFGQYVGTSPDENAAMQMIRDQVAAGNPMMDAANANLEATLRGDYLNSPIQDYLTTQFANYETPDLDYLRNAASGAYLNSNPAQDWLLEQMRNYEVPDTAGLRDTASGMYLSPDSNPWLQATYDRAARQVSDNYLNTTQPRTDALFNRASAFGPQNSAYAEIVARNQYGLGENLGNLATDIYGGNYQTERNRQFAAQGQLPQLGLAGQAARMGAANAYSQNYGNERALQQAAGIALPTFGNQAANIRLGAAGQYGTNYNAERARQQAATAFAPTLSQSRFDDAMRLYGLGDMWRQPTMNTFNWGSGLLRGAGSQSTSSTPQYSNPLAGVLGGMFVGSQFGRGLFG